MATRQRRVRRAHVSRERVGSRSCRIAEGALIGVTALPEVAIIRGGAHVGFPEPGGVRTDGLHLVHSGVGRGLHRDRSHTTRRPPLSGTGLRRRAGSALLLLRWRRISVSASAIRSADLGFAADAPIKIPSHGFDGAPRIPKTGTLQLNGLRQVWIIDGGANRPIGNVFSRRPYQRVAERSSDPSTRFQSRHAHSKERQPGRAPHQCPDESSAASSLARHGPVSRGGPGSMPWARSANTSSSIPAGRFESRIYRCRRSPR